MKRFFTLLVIIFFVVLAAATAYLSWTLLEGTAPEILVEDAPEIMGRSSTISVQVRDDRSGIKSVSAEVIQGDRKIPLEPINFPVHDLWRGSGVMETRASWGIKPKQLGLSENDITIRIHAHDSSFRNGLKGNEAILDIKMPVDFTPPSIFLKSTVHNIRQGGCGLVSYNVNEEVIKTGVRTGKDHFFPARLQSEKNKTYFALVAIPFDLNAPGNIVVEAEDRAGNIGKTGVPFRLLPLREHRDRINISDNFLKRKMPDFMARDPELTGDLLSVFLKINNKMRKDNNDTIKRITMKSQTDMVWNGRFARMAGATRAGFADHRYYFYKGKEIDQAFHMGVDIASVAHAPVPAANNGKVVFAEYLGIYGNTVIIDHGAGLFSLYGHLSVINVTPGQDVKRGEIIGQTGFTGLAGGDHLHFAMLVHGVFVNPVEWWDKTWIKTHILANLES